MTVEVKPEPPRPQYLGDGVYARFDGYYLNIAVNHHTNHAVALDSSVFKQLVEYARSCDRYALALQGNSPDAVKYFGV